MYLTSKGAVHYLTNGELDENENYLKSRISTEKKIVTLVLGGPTRYYDYNNQVIDRYFLKN